MEEWRDIPGYEGLYQVSDSGKVKSLFKIVDIGLGREQPKPERILKSGKGSHGYLTVHIKKSFCVHRLVAQTFIPNPMNLKCINHKDGDKLNNNIDNLEWVSHATNNKHAYASGLKKPFRKITSEDVEFIRQSSLKNADLARLYNVNPATISEIVNYKTRLNG